MGSSQPDKEEAAERKIKRERKAKIGTV